MTRNQIETIHSGLTNAQHAIRDLRRHCGLLQAQVDTVRRIHEITTGHRENPNGCCAAGYSESPEYTIDRALKTLCELNHELDALDADKPAEDNDGGGEVSAE